MNRFGKIAPFVALWLLRLTLSGIFLYAGALKIHDAQPFSESVAEFRLLPAALVNPVALMLPCLEIFAAILALGGGRGRRIGALGLLTMLAVFLVALVSAKARGLNIECGCFGTAQLDVLSPTKNLWAAVARDAALGAAAWVAYLAAQAERA